MEKKRKAAEKLAPTASAGKEPAAVAASHEPTPAATVPAGVAVKGRQVEDAEVARERPVVRCKACEIRFEIPLDITLAECPHCGAKWRISWPAPGHAFVSGQA